MSSIQSFNFLGSFSDSEFTLSNIISKLETVQNWSKLGDWLGVPSSKRESREVTLNYYCTTVPNASWQRISGTLHCMEEYKALESVRNYFERQPGMYYVSGGLRDILNNSSYKL